MAALDDRWRAIAREAAVAAEHFGIGATALGRANYAQPAYFGQAMFALSIATERSCKLIVVCDHAVANGGSFPPERTFRALGHNLPQLMQRVSAIAAGYPDIDELESSDIQDQVLDIIGTFARNVTRYYNLDLLAGATLRAPEPSAAWFTGVTERVLARHVRQSSVERVERNAAQMHAALAGVSRVMFTDELGRPLTSAFEASRRTGLTELSRPWERMYVLRIARCLGRVLSQISYASYTARVGLPHLSEFFAHFMVSDRHMRSRSSWSIY